jgi:hypothetical protein
VIILIVVLASSGGGGGTKPAATVAKGPGEIFLEPTASVGPDPFTASVAAPTPSPTVPPNVPITLGQAVPPNPAPTAPTFSPGGASQPPSGGTAAIAPVSGATPGLYGGTRNQSSCDQRQMVDYLTRNPSLGGAWAQAQGILPSEVPGYINSLTPVLLRSDTRVTNHGFSQGRPTPHQSVLQAGTAVLIDDKGEPRARCACGNPLLPPQPVPTTPTYTGSPWPGFSPGNVTVINKSTTNITTITIIDVTTGTPFGRTPGTSGTGDKPLPTTTTTTTTTTTATTTTTTRPQTTNPPGTGLTVPPNVNLGTGDVQVTLLWTSSDDLDLHVTDPTGYELYYGNARAPSTSPSGGQLDHDEIPGCSTASATHVENIYWPRGGAPAGAYQAFVKNFHSCGAPASFELRITVRGRVVYDQTGTLPATSFADSTKVPFQA